MPEHRRLLGSLPMNLPIIQAPMADAHDHELAVAVSNAGGLGSIACGTLTNDEAQSQIESFRAASSKALNLNFLCYEQPAPDPERDARWRAQLADLYTEFDVDSNTHSPVFLRPFDDHLCALIEAFRPEVVSFHFGLPQQHLLERVRATGAKIISSATTLAEARFLEQHGCDAIVAQGVEAGGHRGMFLTDDLDTQSSTLSLTYEVAEALRTPVIAAGGIADASGVLAALDAGAIAVQVGTRFLKTHEARISKVHRELLLSQQYHDTVVTNVFTGRPSRSFRNRFINEIGPINDAVPEFPLATTALAPLKAATVGTPDFVPLWAGTSAWVGSESSAADVVSELVNSTYEAVGNSPICTVNI